MPTVTNVSEPVACAQCVKRSVTGGRRGNGEGSITATWGRLRADGSRAVRHRIALRVPGKAEPERRSTNDSHADAVRLLNELKASIAQRGTPPPRAVTVGHLVDQYLNTRRSGTARGR